MKSALLRTTSVPVHPLVLSDSPKLKLSRQNSFTGSPRISLHMDTTGCRRNTPIRRRQVMSTAEIIRTETKVSGAGSRSFAARIPEVEEEEGVYLFAWPRSGITVEERGFSGDGFGKGKKSGGGGNGGKDDAFSDDVRKIGKHYKQMLKSNPGDALLLRNYAKYLHEVEGDMERAEEYYRRAILASPGDGELLSLYGKLIWECKGDRERAKTYFDQAVFASPNDCMVMGLYANFMWEAEEEDEGEEIIVVGKGGMHSSAMMVGAF